jgi:hypothetical protein
MPHTYPSPAVRQYEPAGRRPCQFHKAPQELQPLHERRYLSPNQHARVLSWRSQTTSTIHSPSNPTSAANPDAKSKSAPSSFTYDTAAPPSSPCAACIAISNCSCSTTVPASSRNSPRSTPRGYYSNKNKRSAKESASNVRTMIPYANPSAPTIQSNQVALTVPPSPAAVDKKGMPSPQQVEAHALGAPPAMQTGNPPMVPIPPGVVAYAVPPKVETPTPRIAGARDPITQN